MNGAHVPGMPPVSTSVPVPAEALGTNLPGVQLGQRPRRRGDNFGWPANAAPGKPEGEVDTRGCTAAAHLPVYADAHNAA